MSDLLTVLCGDALERLRELPDESVQCCVTSPPYWGLRDYSTNGQLGLEKTPDEYVAKMVEIFREVRRVLRRDGTLWLNMGDSYAQSGSGPTNNSTHKGEVWRDESYPIPTFRSAKYTGQPAPHTAVCGLKPKDLCGIPWRVAFALQADGWWLRSDIIWSKPNPMPESVTDRPTKAHEYLFLLTKASSYYYDAEAIKEQHAEASFERAKYDRKIDKTNKGEPTGINRTDDGRMFASGLNALPYFLNEGGRNKRSVWTVATAPYPEAHFATYPPDLIKPCIMAGTSARGCCAKCGAPWERVVEPTPEYAQIIGKSVHDHKLDGIEYGMRQGGKGPLSGGETARRCPDGKYKTLGWQPTCRCKDELGSKNEEVEPCTVLDPFAGSGTTGTVALELGRRAVLIELNPAYVKLIHERCSITPGLALA